MAKQKLKLGIKVIIVFHVVNLVLWTFGQTYAIFDYDTSAAWGLQAPRMSLNPAIVEVNRGIALADTIVYFPMFIIGIIGLLRMKFYGAAATWMAMGITFYWPTVFWCSQYFYGSSGIKYLPTTIDAVIVPGIFIAISAWASWYLYRNRDQLT